MLRCCALAGFAHAPVLEILAPAAATRAAVLSRLCVEVYGMERLKGLNEKARTPLRRFAYPMCIYCWAMACWGFIGRALCRHHCRSRGYHHSSPGQTSWPWVGRLVAPTRLGQSTQSLVVIDKHPPVCANRVGGCSLSPVNRGIG